MRLLLTALLLVAYGGSVWAQTPSAWQAPADAASRENPLKGKPELAAGGRKLYIRNCTQCHGTGSGETRNNAPMLASQQVQRDSDGALFWKITNGNTRTGMPSFSSLPENQRWQLVLYIRTLGGAAGEEPQPTK